MTSIRRHPSTLPIRPISDKDLELVDLDQLFEEYVETDLLHQLNNSTAERSSSDDLVHLFDLPSSTDSEVPASSLFVDRLGASWQPSSQRFYQDPALFTSNDSSSFRIDAKTKGSLSDSGLLNFEDLFELERNQLRSDSQPSTPRPHNAKAVKKAVSFQEKTLPRGIHKLKKSSSSSFSAKMIHPTTFYQRAPVPELWTQKLVHTTPTFGLTTASHNIHSPPASAKIKHENENVFFSQGRHEYDDEHSPLTTPDPNLHELSFTNYELTPQPSPNLEMGNNHHNTGHFNNVALAYSAPVSSAALSALQTPPSSITFPATTWGCDGSPNLKYSFAGSTGLIGANKSVEWTHDVSMPTNQSASAYREPSAPSTSEQHIHYSSGGFEELGITCDHSSFGEFSGLGINNIHEQHVPSSSNSASATAYQLGGYGEVYATLPQPHMVSIGQPPSSRTPSPTPQLRFHRRRPSTQSHQQNNRAVSTQRRKSSTNNQQARQGSGGGGGVGFVNFTPDDSRKILTGVAPSGSSKTKARREKEAAEKRRKLSQAAMRAVIEAGGNVENLKRMEREGLLVLENVDISGFIQSGERPISMRQRRDSKLGMKQED